MSASTFVYISVENVTERYRTLVRDICGTVVGYQFRKINEEIKRTSTILYTVVAKNLGWD